MSDPLVSVIIAAYNGERYLKEALGSVLAQDYPNFEIVVVNDGSTDGTAEILDAYSEVRAFHQSNHGEGYTRNRGFKEGKGDFISFIDCDDLWHKSKLSKQVDYFKEHPETDYCITHAEFFVDEKSPFPYQVREKFLNQPLLAYLPSALMTRREVYAKVPFNELKMGADVDWFCRVKEAGFTVGKLEDTLLYRRLHGDNMTKNLDENYQFLLKVLRESVERKQKAKS